ncbi:MAG: hypothetical protein Q8L29_01050 [archaeon]|nr:hypothetical protein [archaeon]
MANHKTLSLFLMSILLINISLAFVSAAETTTTTETITTVTTTVTNSVTNVIDYIEEIGSPLFNALLGQTTSGGELFLKILVFALVTLVIYGVIGVAGNPFGTGWINVLAGAIISIIGIRFMPKGFLEAMTIPSSGLVALVVMVVPLILAFFLIEKMPNKSARKVLWISYIVIMIILWFYNWDNANIGKAIWVYPIIISTCIFVFLFDEILQRGLRKAEEGNIIERSTKKEIDLAALEVKRFRKALGDASTPEERKRLQKELREAEANLYALESS